MVQGGKMGKKLAKMAIIYDFDGTLSPRNIQEYDFIPQLKMTSKKFWKEVGAQAKKHGADKILTYMYWMIKKAGEGEEGLSVRKEDFCNYGRNVKLFDGVRPWFKRINDFGRKRGLHVEHYIVSSGIQEMIKASPIRRSFKKIFASSFIYDNSGVATWPALGINYTTKTQFLFRINKGCLDITDDKKINQYVPKEDRPIPFERMIYIGDGDTDIPCMKLVRDQGGHSIAVYRPHVSRARNKALNLIVEGRVHYVVLADYRPNRKLDKIVKSIITKISADANLVKPTNPKKRSTEAGGRVAPSA